VSAPFDITDSSTWPVVLTAEQVAAIYQRPVGGVKKACQLHRFVPAPFQVRPFRFRKTDVTRHLEGGRGPARVAWRA
jgi:hypothetical protein